MISPQSQTQWLSWFFMSVSFLFFLCFSHAWAEDEAPSQYSEPPAAHAASQAVDLWNAVRQREPVADTPMRTQIQGVDTADLVNIKGDEWRYFRMETLIPNAAWLLGLVLLGITVFRLVRGKIPIHAGRSRYRIQRFSDVQRLFHWVTATLFVILAVTGVVMLFGRYLIIPVLGPEIGGPLIYVFKRLHDFSGPVFAVSLLALVIVFIKGNFPSLKTDLQWIMKGGGLFGKHASAGRYNAGEKAWYWVVLIVGAFVVVSGLVLNFPNFEQSRNTMMYYHWIHSISAVVVMAISMGHIYMGTVAMEGAFEAMATGHCDANWAKEHHDLWYEEVKESAFIPEEQTASASASTESKLSDDNQKSPA